MDDSNFPNGVCKQCHEAVVVLIRKKDLKEHETARKEETFAKTKEIDLDDLMRTGIN